MRKGKMKKAVVHTAVLMLLIASIGLPGLIHASARVDLPTAPISTANNVQCTFAGNIISDSRGARVPTMKSFFDNGLNTQSMYDPQLHFEDSGKWGFDDKAKQIDSAFGDEDSAELVMGLSNVRPTATQNSWVSLRPTVAIIGATMQALTRSVVHIRIKLNVMG